MPSGHLILHQNQNQAAWAVKFHSPCTERHQSSQGDVSYPEMHYTHLAHFSQRFMHWMRAEFWHNVVTPAAKSENQESCQTFRKGSSGGWARPGNTKDFSCARAWISVQWREGVSSKCDRLKPALALVLLQVMWWPVPNSAGNQLWRFICTSDLHLSNS